MRNSMLIESSCRYLLQELKLIWDEVGEDQIEREKALLELEEECREVCRRKVDRANTLRARLHQLLVDSQAEYTNLLVSLGEGFLAPRPEKLAGTLKQQLDSITPALSEMKKRKDDRVKQFQDVRTQIQRISSEISGNEEPETLEWDVNQGDLSLKRLEDYKIVLQKLYKEKNDRLKKVDEYLRSINSLCAVLGMDSSQILGDIHTSMNTSFGLQLKNINSDTLAKLNDTLAWLKDEKKKRLDKLKMLAKTLKSLWSLMDTPVEEQRAFAHVTATLLASSPSSSDISSSVILTLEVIHKAEVEVERLDQLKATKMKVLFYRKRMELEEICKRSHLDFAPLTEMDSLVDLINSGEIDTADLLASMDEHIARAKEEASSRKDIMEKVDKWTAACEEERWLEEYNKDESRYAMSRGAHKNLKRAERARIMVTKIPALVELLIVKTRTWEAERKKVLLYEDVPLLDLLDEYTLLRQEKENEKQRQREKKKVQSKVNGRQEILFSPRPGSSSSRFSTRYLNTSFSSTVPVQRRPSTGMNSTIQGTSLIKENSQSRRPRMPMHLSYSYHRDDSTSEVSATFSGPQSP
ncbi:65-kDa microtubule-associated protein 8 [Nymphaea colorata]|nr:65-kDa microtubule-associated protein 8 [Nymphaea colorata]